MNKLFYKKNYQILIAIVFILAGLFYWYEYRPSNIKKECVEIAKEKVLMSEINLRLLGDEKYSSLKEDQKNKFNITLREKFKEERIKDFVISEEYEKYEDFYNTCLTNKGL